MDVNTVNSNHNLLHNLYIIHYHQDDPKKCTAEKLRRLRLVKFVRRPRGIILQPFTNEVLSNTDREPISSSGITALDLSWNRADSWYDVYRTKQSRRLPFLLAANPINYSLPNRLSTAESFAAALYITNYKEESRLMLNTFKWGNTFYQLNKRALDIYASSDKITESEIYIKSNYKDIFRIT